MDVTKCNSPSVWVMALEGNEGATPRLSGGQWWMKKGQSQPVVTVSASCCLQWFEADGWVTVGKSSP